MGGGLGPFLRWNVLYFAGDFAADLNVPYPRLLPGPLWPGREAAVALFYFLPSSVVAEPEWFAALLARPGLSALLVRGIYLLPVALLVLGILHWREPLAILGLLCLTSLRPLADFSHWLDAVLPLVVLAAVVSRGRGRRAIEVALGAGLLLGLFVTTAATTRQTAELPLAGRGTVRIEPGRAEALSGLIASLRQEPGPGAPLMAVPYAPLLNFLDHPAPTAVVLPFPSFMRSEGDAAWREGLSRVEVVVWDRARWPHLPELADLAPRYFQALQAEFRRAERHGTFEVWVRQGSEGGPGDEPEHAEGADDDHTASQGEVGDGDGAGRDAGPPDPGNGEGEGEEARLEQPGQGDR